LECSPVANDTGRLRKITCESIKKNLEADSLPIDIIDDITL